MAARASTACCLLIVVGAVALSVARLGAGAAADGLDASRAHEPPSPALSLALRALAACAWTYTLAHSYTDRTPLKIEHRGTAVYVRGLGRFVTFTLWCNCLVALYWWASAADTALGALGGAPAARAAARACARVLWAVVLPLSWLVAMVVSFVLIPVGRRTDPERVAVMLRWRPLFLHNGYVLSCAAELLVSRPPMDATRWPVMLLFGTGYLLFAYVMYLRLGVFAYFFLDPTFGWAPLAYLALLGLVMLCFHACAAVSAWLAATTSPALGGVLLVGAALGTCTWR